MKTSPMSDRPVTRRARRGFPSLIRRHRRWWMAALLTLLLPAGLPSARAWVSDNGNGTFTNPPLFADYPDPSIIRVGRDFYFATTTFVNSPGLTILHSRDLVNWTIVGHVMPRLEGRPQYDLQDGTAYRSGVFAPSLRYHDGTFYIAVTLVNQNTRIYYSRDIRGPWRYHELDRPAFDPGLFFDTDGTPYIFTSGSWDGHVTLLTLNRDASRVVASHGIFYYRGAEGSKVVKHDGWYYVFNAVPRRLGLICSRAKTILGPYETTDELDDRTGGHQGAIVDLPDGRWFGFVMRDCGAVGRMTYFSPVFWKNGWPVFGTPGAPGQVPSVARIPVPGQPVRQPATADDFSSPTLGLQWQWNHNPDNARWSLTEHPGWLRLEPTAAADFWHARNTLTQKGQGPWSRGEVKLDLSHLPPGAVCGLGTLGKYNGRIAVTRDRDGQVTLSMLVSHDGDQPEVRASAVQVPGTDLYLRTDLDFVHDRGSCAYSVDGTHWTPLGGAFPLAFDWRTGTFQGEQFAIFCYAPHPDPGFVDVDWFRFTGTRPKD